jgi:hypothetical protein
MGDEGKRASGHGYINMKVPAEQYHEVKRFAKSRHQTMTGYLMELHRREFVGGNRAAGPPAPDTPSPTPLRPLPRPVLP